MSTTRLDPRASGVAACLLATLAACGETGGEASRIDDGPVGGTVNVLLTDAPTDDFSAIHVTFERIELLGVAADDDERDDDDGEDDDHARCDDDDDDDGEQRRAVLFEGRETLDLLRLENFANLFAVAPDVPAATYCKLRLIVSAIELVERGSGESHFPPLPGGGKLDLLGRDGFTVAPGDALVVEIDLDAKKSIHARATSDGYRFRPVVFVKVSTATPEVPGKLVRVQGWVNRADAATASIGLQLGGIGGEQIAVQIVADGVVFDAQRNRVAVDFRVGDNRATAYGAFSASDPALFEAVLVQVGTPSSYVYATYAGTVRDAPLADRFAFDLDPGQPGSADPALAVALAPDTLVYSGAGDRLAVQAIAAGARAEIDGVLVPAPAAADTLLASLVVLPVAAASGRLSGQLAALDDGAGTSLTLATAEGDRCVRTAGARVVVSVESAAGVAIGPGSVAGIVAGTELEAYGEVAADGCLEAHDLVVHGGD